jgi:hypothetical protein
LAWTEQNDQIRYSSACSSLNSSVDSGLIPKYLNLLEKSCQRDTLKISLLDCQWQRGQRRGGGLFQPIPIFVSKARAYPRVGRGTSNRIWYQYHFVQSGQDTLAYLKDQQRRREKGLCT